MERDRMAVMRQVSEGMLTPTASAARLGVTRRRMRRLTRRFEVEGDGAAIHGLQGRRSNRASETPAPTAAARGAGRAGATRFMLGSRIGDRATWCWCDRLRAGGAGDRADPGGLAAGEGARRAHVRDGAGPTEQGCLGLPFPVQLIALPASASPPPLCRRRSASLKDSRGGASTGSSPRGIPASRLFRAITATIPALRRPPGDWTV